MQRFEGVLARDGAVEGATGNWLSRRVAVWTSGPGAVETLVADGAVARRFSVADARGIEPVGSWQPAGLRAAHDWIEGVAVRNVAGRTYVGLASAYGRLTMHAVEGAPSNSVSLGAAGPPLGEVIDVALPNPTLRHSAGWLGLDWHPHEAGVVAVTSEVQRHTHVLRGERCERSIRCAGRPYHVAYHTVGASAAPLLVLLEESAASVIDPRVAEHNGYVQRVTPSSGHLYGADAVDTLLAVGGADRSAFVYDVRKWAVVGSWGNALKHEIATLYFSSDSNVCIAASGTDSELAAGSWTPEGAKRFREASGVRADGRWLGLACARGTNTALGVSSLGSLYVCQDVVAASLEAGRRLDDDAL